MRFALILLAVLGFTANAQTVSNGWTKRFDAPELTASGQPARPQAVLALGNDDLIVSAHFNNAFSRVYRVQPSTQTTIGQFQFPSPYVHIAAAAQRADGSIWFADYATGTLLHVDLTASLSSGSAVILEARTVMDANLLSGLAWATVNGEEFLLLAEYRTTGSPVMVILNHESGRRLVVTQRLQGIVYKDGVLYIASNRLTGESTAVGRLQTIDFAAFIASGPTNDTWLNYVLSTEAVPSAYPEDLSFSPDGVLWTATEGENAVGTIGWLAYWSRP